MDARRIKMGSFEMRTMTESDIDRKLDELDRLLNDPDVVMEPARVWSLLAELSQPDSVRSATPF